MVYFELNVRLKFYFIVDEFSQKITEWRATTYKKNSYEIDKKTWTVMEEIKRKK